MESIFTKKNKIEINMWSVGVYIEDSGFLGLIFGGRGLEKHRRDNYIPDDDMTNILALSVLILFNNLKTMVIRSVDDYPFSLYQLVLLLRHTKMKGSDIWK